MRTLDDDSANREGNPGNCVQQQSEGEAARTQMNVQDMRFRNMEKLTGVSLDSRGCEGVENDCQYFD
jgi:hypothetical protein